MLILCTAFFAWILAAKCGIQWEGAAAAYILALFCDAVLIAFLIFRLTERAG